MKLYSSLCLGSLFIIASISGFSQTAGSGTAAQPADSLTNFRIALENFPHDKPINFINGWGGMTVAVNEMPAGTNLAPLLEGLKNNSCQAPHWGMILKGRMNVKYDNGELVTLKAGDLFYMPPGHTATVEEDLKIMDFSPEKEMTEVVDHINKKLAKPSK